MEKKHAMSVLAWTTLAALIVLVGIISLKPQAIGASPTVEANLPARQEAPATVQGAILSAAAYSGLPGAPAARSEPQAMYLLFVPHVTVGDLSSTLFIQNLAVDTAYVMVSYYAPDGTLQVSSELYQIPGHGSRTLGTEGLPFGFEGSAVIESDEPLQAVVNLQGITTDSLLSYTAVPAGSTEAVLLSLARNYAGWNSSFSIQNTGASAVNVTISYYSAAGPVYSTDTISPSASHVYRQADMPELGPSFVGYALVQANGPIAAVVENWNTTNASASAFNGIPLTSAGMQLLFPRQQKSVDGWISAVQAANLGAETAFLLAQWYSDSGSPVWDVSSTVPPGSLMQYVVNAIPEIPSGFDGSLRLEATEPVAAVAQSRNQDATGDGQAMTAGLGLDQLSMTAYLPRVAYVEIAGLSTEISILNGSSEASAETTIDFYDQSGAKTTTVTDSIPPYGVTRYDTAAVPALGPDWQGSAVVSANQPIAVEAMQVVRYTPPPCYNPLSSVVTVGPTSGYTGTTYAFTAVITPVEATLPISYTWTPAPESGQGNSTAEYAWAETGVYSLAVTAENCGGVVTDSHVILVGSAVTAAVDPESGGSLVYTNTEGLTTIVDVPAGAVDEAITLVYLPQEPGSPPAGFRFVGHGFDLEGLQDGTLLQGLTFDKPVTVTINYSDADIAAIDEESLTLQYWTGSAWEDAACGLVVRNTDENWIAVPICHLSQFGLLGEISHRVYLPLVTRAKSAH